MTRSKTFAVIGRFAQLLLPAALGATVAGAFGVTVLTAYFANDLVAYFTSSSSAFVELQVGFDHMPLDAAFSTISTR
jgi:hypothetical protein